MGVGADGRRGPGRERLVRLSILLAGATGVYYVVWRLLFTLNTEALWLSIPLWAAEAFGLTAGLLFFFTVWDTGRRSPPTDPPPGLTVDVFVPTYNEPVWIVRRTLLGARGIRYPHQTWLLDDGKRPEMEALARELGVHYLTRADNLHAKAGNLNNALSHSSGEFVAFFDADHVAMPDFLDRTLGDFLDERVAFVQTPHEFYNVDSYQHRVDRDRKRMWHEQALFYRLIQPGKDRWNAAFFCGSCAVIRRRALEDVGGIATETVTEDLHTSIRIHGRGWRSVYRNEVLAYGISPQTPLPYHVQRLRWGQGAMQVLRRRDNPLLASNLTLAQRLNYFASNLHYFEGFEKLVFYLAPPIYLSTGILPIRAVTGEFVVRFLAYYLSLYLAFRLSSRGHGVGILSEAYKMARYYTYIKTTFGLLARRKLKFAVTQKEGETKVPVGAAVPQLFVLGTSLAGLGIGAARLSAGAQAAGLAVWVNAGWSLWHMGLATWSARQALRSGDVRRVHRPQIGLPVRWRAGPAGGVGVLLDMHEDGGRVLVRDWPGGQEMTIDVLWPGTPLRRTGEVRWTRRDPGGAALGLRWRDVSEAEAEDAAFFGITFGQRKFVRDIDHPLDRVGMLDLRRNVRKERREPVTIPARLLGSEPEVWGVVEDRSARGALVLLPAPPERGERLRLAPWGEEHDLLDGRVMWVQDLRLAPHQAYRAGIDRSPAGTGWSWRYSGAGAAGS